MDNVNPEETLFNNDEEGGTETAVLFVIITLLIIFFLQFFYHAYFPKLIRYVLPESALIALVGILCGLALRESDSLKDFIAFSPEIFFAILLPPIIFYAGFSLEKAHGHIFFSNIGTILVFAIFGTLLSTVVIAMLSYAAASGGIVSLSLVECWLFGSLLSAVDPVATIAIFEAFHVENTLFNLVFGESVLNDAVAIVLYRTVNRFTKEGNVLDAGSFFYAIGEFCWISAGSVGIGLGFGACMSLISKYLKLHGDLPTLSLLILAYISYILSEVATLSGIMTILTFGIVVGHYSFINMEEEDQSISFAVTRIIGTTAEAFVFAYIGLSVFGVTEQKLNVLFIFIVFLFCLLGRAVNTFPLSLAMNLVRKRKIPFKTQFVIWFSGLRGAIAFALSLDVETENKSLIKTTTLGIVLITTFLVGGATLPLLEFLRIVGPNSKPISEEETAELEAVTQSKMWFLRLDRRFLTPFFCQSNKIPEDRRDTASSPLSGKMWNSGSTELSTAVVSIDNAETPCPDTST